MILVKKRLQSCDNLLKANHNANFLILSMAGALVFAAITIVAMITIPLICKGQPLSIMIISFLKFLGIAISVTFIVEMILIVIFSFISIKNGYFNKK